MRPPEGYEAIRAAGARAFARPGERSWVERLLVEHGSLYEAAPHLDERVVLEGRAPVYAVPSPVGRRVIRRYHRGGLIAPILGDRHLRLGTPRPVREARASREVRRRGIPTPPVTAGAIYPAGAFYRADLVTEYLAGSMDLAEILFGGRGPLARREALERAGRLLAGMAAAGVRHPDLNAKNVLFAPRNPKGTTSYETYLLDLDRCRPTKNGASVPPDRMLSRLRRSLEKLARTSGDALTGDDVASLRTAALRPPPTSGAGDP